METYDYKERVSTASNEYPAWVEINLGRLQKNLLSLQGKLGPLKRVLPVVKADAYGHGAVAVSRRLEGIHGLEGFAVASVPEGVELRVSGIRTPIILLEFFLSGQEKHIAEYDLTAVVSGKENVDRLALQGKNNQKTINVQVRLDTGYGNMGISLEELPELLKYIKEMEWLECSGIFTHLYASYFREDKLVDRQLSFFKRGLELAEKMGVPFSGMHAASSPAILHYPDSHYSLVRPGTILYGLPSFEGQHTSNFQPVMQLKTRIAHIKNLPPGTAVAGYNMSEKKTVPLRLATIPLGSADAYYLGNLHDGHVLINGKKAPIIGSAFMMHILVDVTEIPNGMPGDEVVLFGEQGEEVILAEELARKSGIGIINCEKVCFVNSRVPRYYRD